MRKLNAESGVLRACERSSDHLCKVASLGHVSVTQRVCPAQEIGGLSEGHGKSGDDRVHGLQELALAPNLTALIGGRGAGKSTAIEALRWACTGSASVRPHLHASDEASIR